jgi:hypothetical protein
VERNNIIIMVVYNAVTELKQKQPRYLTSQKKRKSTSSTVAQCMYAKDAMAAYWTYMLAHKKALCYLVMLMALRFDFQSPGGSYLHDFLLLAAANYASKAACMLRLNSELLDLQDADLEDIGYNNELHNITLATYINNDECENNTRFSKLELLQIISYLGFGDGNGYI